MLIDRANTSRNPAGMLIDRVNTSRNPVGMLFDRGNAPGNPSKATPPGETPPLKIGKARATGQKK
jgi:hypothetical protein